jgi:predicted RNase H-like HicB family nuclease
MHLTIEIEQEKDGRWLTEVLEVLGVMAYGKTQEEAIAKVQTLTLRVLADRLEHGEITPEISEIFSVAA